MLLELVQQFGCAGCNFSIMAMAVVFIKLQHVLPTDSYLVGTNFANVSKLVQLDNRWDVQGWIKILYTRDSRDMTLFTYHKIDLIIFWFINTTRCCQRLILACFICKQAFQYLDHANYCDNYIYTHIQPKAIPEFSA